MPLDAGAVRRACGGAAVTTGRQLCRAELDRFRAVAAGGGPLVVACTQEAPLFREIAEEQLARGQLTFVNIREAGGLVKGQQRGRPKNGGADRGGSAKPLPSRNISALESQVSFLYTAKMSGLSKPHIS